MKHEVELFDGRPLQRLRFTEWISAGGQEYLLWRGDTVVGFVTSLAEAEAICRTDQGMRRMASDRTNDLRRHEIEKNRHKHEVEVLVGTLQKVNAVLRTGKERELQKAKEEAAGILRKFAKVRSALLNGHAAGFSLVETLAALVLIFLLLTLATSVISQGIRASRIRVASEQLTMDLRLARLTAVTKSAGCDFFVSTDPVNEYHYVDLRGKLHSEVMPPGVRLTTSPTQIHFQANGSVPGGATTVLEIAMTASTLERRTIATSVLGVPRVTVARLQS